MPLLLPVTSTTDMAILLTWHATTKPSPRSAARALRRLGGGRCVMADRKSVSDKEKAEGEREMVDEAVDNQTSRGYAPKADEQGISNRPAAEEERQQQKLPPRGEANE
jgi:hypothetical protein